MTSKQCVWVAMLVLAGVSGCAMCDNVEDSTYPAFGGKWQRDNPTSGRVGSVFDPAGMQVVDRNTPTEAEPSPAAPEGAAPEGVEEETSESLLAEPEETPEAADMPKEQPEDAAAEMTPSEPAAGQQAESDAQADPDPAPAPGGIALPELPGQSAGSQLPKGEDKDLLPPLESPPQ